MSKTVQQLNEELDANIPRSAVSQRSGGGTKALSYLEAWYVIDRLNQVFGNLGWDSETVEMAEVGGGKFPAYRAKVRIKAIVEVAPGQFLNVCREGTGWGADKSAQNPHEMACKEAESDAFKRAAMKFGRSLGLALYDKTQEHVEDEEPRKPFTRDVTQHVPKHDAPSADITLKKISTASMEVIKQKLMTMNDLTAILKNEFKADRKEDLNAEQAAKLLAKLEEILVKGVAK